MAGPALSLLGRSPGGGVKQAVSGDTVDVTGVTITGLSVPASGSTYTPSVSGNWLPTAPSYVNTALDALADRVANPASRGVLVTDEDFLGYSISGGMLLGATVSWQVSTSGTGAAVAAATAAEVKASTPGCVALASPTTVTGRAGILLGPSTGAGSVKVSDGSNLAVFDYETTWFFTSLFTAAEVGWFLTGLISTINAVTAGNYGIFWRYDGGAAHNLSAIIRMGGAETGSVLNVLTVAANTIYRTRVVSDGATVKWMYATGRSGGSWTTALTISAATINADAGWQTTLVGATARITKTAAVSASIRAIVDRIKLNHSTF